MLITWHQSSVSVEVGQSVAVSFTTGQDYELMRDISTSDSSVATISTTGSGFSGVATIVGVSAGTATTVPGGSDTQNTPLTITVTAPTPADDQNFLNERGLARFWDNIDDIKQNKLTAGAGISITNDVISATGGGEADSVAWGHITGSMSNQTDLTTALAAKANSADLATVATSGDYDDLTDKPTIGNATLTIQKNGTSAGTFTANATSNKTINITVPTTAADVSALPASTKYGASIAVSINTTDYKVTTTLKDQDGNTLGTAQVIDLPLESVVVNGSYDNTNKKIVLTLQNGNTIDIPVADLVAGLQSEITSSNKLSSDLVDDTNHTHKFVTAAQITKLNGIAAGAEVNVQSDWDQTTTTADDYIKNKPSLATVATSGSYNDLSDKPTIPAAQVNSDWNATSGKAQILNKPTLATVATSGSYNDLSNKPTIPAAQVQSNWTQTTTTAVDYIKNKPTLATVATSGSYNDLSNKPTIPDKQVFYGTSDSSGSSSNKAVTCSGFTYAEGSVIYVTFSNADTYSGDSGMTMNVNSTGEKVIFTQTTSGGGIQSDHKWAAGETVCFVCHNDRYLMVEAAMATTTTSGLMSVNDKNKLDGIAAGAEVNVQANWTESDSSSDAYIQNKPTLATVATSGSYDDLSDKPTIPTATSELVNDSGFITSDTYVTQTLTAPYSFDVTYYPVASTALTTNTSTVTKFEAMRYNQHADSFYGNAELTLGRYDSLFLQGRLSLVSSQDSHGWKTTFCAPESSAGADQLIYAPVGVDTSLGGRLIASYSKGSATGSATNPVYADAQGILHATTYALNKTVPSDAVFTDTTYSDATTSAAGLMSAADKTKLNGIAAGAEVNVQSDWDVADTTSDAFIKNKPTIPTVNDATLTIQQNGTDVQTFTANQSTNATANITVPTATSDLTNDGASGSSAYVEADELATVATTGAYGDLSGTPTIPTVNNATLTIQKNGSNVQTFTANQSTNATANITVPTKTSELTNNSGFLTSVATANIADRAVTTAKLAAGIVTMTRTQLYSSSGTAANITVSQALNKFDEVEFWIKDTNGTPNQLIRTIPGNALAIVLDIPHPGGSNTVYWNIARWSWTAGATSLTYWSNHYQKNILASSVSTSTSTAIQVTKIVGIKFVSN